MLLIKLTASQKIADRWYAEFADGERIPVNTALIADFSLFTGRELCCDEYEELRKAAKDRTAKTRALRILGTRSMSRHEITRRLQEKGESEETAHKTAEWLERIGAINDAEYAPMLVRHYAGKGYGKNRIKSELVRRGVPRELWEEALSELPEQDETLDRFIRQKMSGRMPTKADIKRVTDALIRKGFSWDEIKSALRRYGESSEDFE